MPPVFRGIKVHLHADRLHVSEQELDTDMEHANCQEARYMSGPRSRRAHVPPCSARGTFGSLPARTRTAAHTFSASDVSNVIQGTDFSSICRKEFDYGKTPSLYPPFHPLMAGPCPPAGRGLSRTAAGQNRINIQHMLQLLERALSTSNINI